MDIKAQTTLKQKHWLSSGQLDMETFKDQVQQTTRAEDWPFASAIEQNALVYNATELHDKLSRAVKNTDSVNEVAVELMAEWAEAFLNGPGIIVIKGAFVDSQDKQNSEAATTSPNLDTATRLFEQLIESERQESKGAGDHFAKPGANDRVWNSLEKHCINDPESFIAYYKNPFLALVSEAWLGPCYQVTAQVNRVNPGGAAQVGHRDYHLGFMSREQAARYPAHVHRLSPCLTLQGAIAHCDMPLESGPTLYLPYSQQVLSGYVDFSSDEFQDYFAQHCSQYALEKGDAVFFNPALMHAAGHNTSKDIYRLANLLQVSSSFGRAIESVDHLRMQKALYPALQQCKQNSTLTEQELNAVISSSAEGYAFPTNLDTDLPVNGLAPLSQASIVKECLENDLDTEAAMETLNAHRLRTLSS